MVYNNDCNEIVISQKDFKEDFWDTVGQLIKILTTAGYECKVFNDDMDIYVIQYVPQDFKYGGKSFQLVSEDDLVSLENSKSDEQNT